jgi:hypothetical protein
MNFKHADTVTENITVHMHYQTYLNNVSGWYKITEILPFQKIIWLHDRVETFLH